MRFDQKNVAGSTLETLNFTTILKRMLDFKDFKYIGISHAAFFINSPSKDTPKMKADSMKVLYG